MLLILWFREFANVYKVFKAVSSLLDLTDHFTSLIIFVGFFL